MPLQTVAALPTRPLMGHAQADDGNPDAISASKAISTIEGRSHFFITTLNTHAKSRRSSPVYHLVRPNLQTNYV